MIEAIKKNLGRVFFLRPYMMVSFWATTHLLPMVDFLLMWGVGTVRLLGSQIYCLHHHENHSEEGINSKCYNLETPIPTRARNLIFFYTMSFVILMCARGVLAKIENGHMKGLTASKNRDEDPSKPDSLRMRVKNCWDENSGIYVLKVLVTQIICQVLVSSCTILAVLYMIDIDVEELPILSKDYTDQVLPNNFICDDPETNITSSCDLAMNHYNGFFITGHVLVHIVTGVILLPNIVFYIMFSCKTGRKLIGQHFLQMNPREADHFSTYLKPSQLIRLFWIKSQLTGPEYSTLKGDIDADIEKDYKTSWLRSNRLIDS